MSHAAAAIGLLCPPRANSCVQQLVASAVLCEGSPLPGPIRAPAALHTCSVQHDHFWPEREICESLLDQIHRVNLRGSHRPRLQKRQRSRCSFVPGCTDDATPLKKSADRFATFPAPRAALPLGALEHGSRPLLRSAESAVPGGRGPARLRLNETLGFASPAAPVPCPRAWKGREGTRRALDDRHHEGPTPAPASAELFSWPLPLFRSKPLRFGARSTSPGAGDGCCLPGLGPITAGTSAARGRGRERPLVAADAELH